MPLEKKIKQQQSINEPNSSEVNGRNPGLLFERIAFYGLLIIILLAAIPYGTVDPWYRSLFVLLACVTAGFRVIEAFVNNSILITDFPLFAPLLAILLLALIQIFPFPNFFSDYVTLSSQTTNCISFDPFETTNFILTFSGLLLTGEMLLRYTTTERRLLALIYLVLLVGVSSALFGLGRLFFSADVFGLPDSVGYAQFINRNHFVFLMEMTLGLLIGLLLKIKPSQTLKTLFWVTISLICFSVISANSRGGILSAAGISVLAVFIYFLIKIGTINFRGERKSPFSLTSGYLKATIIAVLFTTVMFGMIVFIVSFVGGDPVVNRLETIQTETAENKEKKVRRREFWMSTIKLIKENPVVGVGFGAYPAAITKYDESTGQFSLQQAHNDYLELLANGGIIAFFLALIFFGIAIKRMSKQFSIGNSLRQGSCLGAALGLSGILLHSVVDFGLHTTINSLICVVLIVIATANVKTMNEV